ncbi:S-adenosyl-L-methionine-dependent methyltransferase [Coprinopsis sp. MPI-PUGE-AT-0042]|nr:S-adenosyl-L-methionine-dependent methyltransferase [Coprinopsis sp. MPI-PUGE-AT-0042]
MATFAKSTFNVSVYASSRPTYPKQFFDHIFAYHQRANEARFEHAVDLGCGTGQASSALRGRFRKVTCIDPSQKMLEKAKQNLEDGTPESKSSSFSYVQGSAEDLSHLEAGSADMLIAAQACHWFNWAKVWPEAQRVLRKDGTAAFWVYGEIRLPAFPSLTPLITEYAQGTDPNSTASVGAHFQRPGRTILERLLVDVPAPESILEKDNHLVDFKRTYFADPYPVPTDGEEDSLKGQEVLPVLMKASWTWLDLLGYLRTWSALHSYHEAFPEDLKREEDTRFLEEDLQDVRGAGYDEKPVRGGDISVRFWKDLREKVQSESTGADVKGTRVLDKISVEWPVGLLCARRA